MKKIALRVALATLFTMVYFSSVRGQLHYEYDHLFVGPTPVYGLNVGSDPQILIGPEFGIEYFENGLNFWRTYGSVNWGNYKLFLDASGKFGIGRKPTTYALEVNGQVWTTAGLLITSDETYKRNIISLSDSRSGNYIDKIYQLDGKIYDKQISSADSNADEVSKMVELGKINPKDASDALADLNRSNPTVYKKEIGFIAQEVRELFPELVEESADGIMAINYIGLIPLLVESIKDLQKKVTDLETLVGETSVIRSLVSTNNDYNPLSGAVLYQNTPNPFSERTEIKFSLQDNLTNALIYVFNMQGTLLKQYPINNSQSYISINGSELVAGMYLYSLIVDGKVADTKRMILTK